MISNHQRGSVDGELGGLSREWVKKGSENAGLQTQLQFNNSVPYNVLNRATHTGSPSPIVIEKFRFKRNKQEDMESCSSSLCLSVVSEDRLQAAIRLAKRDLRRNRQDIINHSLFEQERSHFITEKSNTDTIPSVISPKTPVPKKDIKHTTPMNVSPQKPCRQSKQSRTLTKDHGVNEPPLSQEIRKVQNELSIYIQKIEQLATKGGGVEDMEPDEKQRMEMKRREQATRSARMIYTLQQQVKEVKENLDKLPPQNMKHDKKSQSSTIERLAAAHRGAVRAMQVFSNQLSDPAENRPPIHCKELGQLIRQLSLCTAKVEVCQGSAVPEAALDILQKLETLDSALNKQEASKKRHIHFQNVKPTQVSARSMSPPCPVKVPVKRNTQRPRKPAAVAKGPTGGRVAAKSQRSSEVLVKERRDILKAGIESLMSHQKQNQEAQNADKATKVINQNHVEVRDASFQQPTVSSRLRENQVPQKEATIPWIPTSPHSPPHPRTVSSRPQPRCLFSSQTSPEKQKPQFKPCAQLSPASHKKKQAENEALREAWLERLTADRLRELHHLSKEESERMKKLRTTVVSPTQWAEKAEKVLKERVQPLLDQAQQVLGAGSGSGTVRSNLKVGDKQVEAGAKRQSDAILEDLLQDTAQAFWVTEMHKEAEQRLQGPTLESMLLRMEEMERDQNEVRQRLATISYSDSLTWERGTAARRKESSCRPASPKPIRLTKPVLNAPGTVDILLKTPVETGAASDMSALEEESLTQNDPNNPAGGGTKQGVLLTVPPRMEKSIQKYRENHDAFLRLISHEALGSFNPWAIADSLAEELLSEALADVAAEFQDVCEEYAEAVFTSEFLQPVLSPNNSVE
ncbi:hypothetical protein DNTS_008155 [Danionella cerebrum]|uniref:Protein moonraker n=1 Tax=Danionella cerebrum TaxID=2873325 RepID=A0A553PUS8_9TELE|nr:hypothetical protein DNTS_008155 [Danionella translucida]